MPIVTKVSRKENNIIRYPCLLESEKGRIVLFFDARKGTIVESTDREEIGRYSEGWQMDCFVPFHGTVALYNHV